MRRFTVDAQLPPALARLLTTHGHQAEHVEDIGLREAEDSPIWHHALKHQSIVVTKDEDFAHRRRQSRRGPVVVWLRVGNTSRRALLRWFEPLIPEVERRIEQGDVLIEVR